MDDVGAIKDQVRIYQLLNDYGVEYLGGDVPEQIHCPFHYPDTNRSCRVYPENDSLYCFVCDKTWDVIEFVKDKEELTFGQAVAFAKSRYDVEIYVPDYEAKLRSFLRQPQEDPAEAAVVFERMFVEAVDALTSGQLSPILVTYNKCLAEKDDMLTAGTYTVSQLRDWYENSVRMLRLELHNG